MSTRRRHRSEFPWLEFSGYCSALACLPPRPLFPDILHAKGTLQFAFLPVPSLPFSIFQTCRFLLSAPKPDSSSASYSPLGFSNVHFSSLALIDLPQPSQTTWSMFSYYPPFGNSSTRFPRGLNEDQVCA